MLTLLAVFFVIIACDKPEEHTHKFASEWNYDEVNHWHSPICEVNEDCLIATLNLSEHTIVDGACSVCDYELPEADGGDGENGSGDENNNDTEGGNGGSDGNNTENGGSDDNNTDNGGDDGGDTNDEPSCMNHQYSFESTVEPTCTESGETKGTCILCGYSYIENVEPTGHKEETVSGKAPSCTESGFSSGKQCSVCGEITKAQVEIAPTGHSFADGACSACGEADPDYNAPDPNAIYTATTNNNCWVDKVSFTAAESGEYTFYLPAGLGAWDADDHASGRPGPVIDSLHPNYIAKEISFTTPIAAGATYEFYIAAVTRQDWIIRWSFVACEVTEPEEDDIESQTVALEMGYNSFGKQSIVYSYTAPSEGGLTLISSVAISGRVDISYSVNGGEFVALAMDSSVTLDLIENDTVIITVIAEGYSSIDASWDGDGSSDTDDDTSLDISGEYIGTDAFGNQMLTVTIDSSAKTVVFYYYHPLTGPNTVNATYRVRNGKITLYDESGKVLHPLSGALTLEDGVPVMASFDGTQYSLSLDIPDQGGGEIINGDIVIKGTMIDGEENSFKVTAGDISVDKMYVSFIPVNDGAYDFLSDHIFIESIMTEDGVKPEMYEYDFYLLKSYVKYIVEINLEYIAHAGTYTITPVYLYPEGHPNNPIWYTVDEYATATYKGDYRPVWYQFYAAETGTLTVTTVTQGVTVMIAAVPNFDIAAVETISLYVEQGRKYYIGVAAYDSTEEIDIIFKASVAEGEITTDGSINTPHRFELGSTTVELQPSEGTYFIYKSTGNGTLTLSANSAGFSWCFTDLSEPAITCEGDISVSLAFGDLVYLYIETNEGLTDAVSFTASFEDDAKQTWISGPMIIDGSEPNSITLEENTFGVFRITGTVGRFILSWDNPDAIVTVNDITIASGDMIYVGDAWFGPYFKICFEGYEAGTIALTITPTE